MDNTATILHIIYKKTRRESILLSDLFLLPLPVNVVGRSRYDGVVVVRPDRVFPSELPLPDEAGIGVGPSPVDRLRDAEEVDAQSVVLARRNG